MRKLTVSLLRPAIRRFMVPSLLSSLLFIGFSFSSSALAGSKAKGKRVTSAKHGTHHRGVNRNHNRRPYRGRHYYGGRRYYRSYGLGYFGRYGRFGYFGYPYGYGYFGYPYYAYAVRSADSGAVDINVKPKKTKVYIDGQLVGKSGKFDGFPNYLWLPKGQYNLVFYHDGYKTVAKNLKVYPGMVLDLTLDMQPGDAKPPEEVAPPPPPPERDVQPRRLEPRSYGEAIPPRRYARPEHRRTERKAKDGYYDLRGKPAILSLQVFPADASVYLDGNFLGTGEGLASAHDGVLLNQGEHKLVVMRPGFSKEVVKFKVEAGEEKTIKVDLKEGQGL